MFVENNSVLINKGIFILLRCTRQHHLFERVLQCILRKVQNYKCMPCDQPVLSPYLTSCSSSKSGKEGLASISFAERQPLRYAFSKCMFAFLLAPRGLNNNEFLSIKLQRCLLGSCLHQHWQKHPLASLILPGVCSDSFEPWQASVHFARSGMPLPH